MSVYLSVCLFDGFNSIANKARAMFFGVYNAHLKLTIIIVLHNDTWIFNNNIINMCASKLHTPYIHWSIVIYACGLRKNSFYGTFLPAFRFIKEGIIHLLHSLLLTYKSSCLMREMQKNAYCAIYSEIPRYIFNSTAFQVSCIFIAKWQQVFHGQVVQFAYKSYQSIADLNSKHKQLLQCYNHINIEICFWFWIIIIDLHIG